MNRKYSKLSDEQYEYIKGEVIALMERLKIKCIPISGFEIATKMGITLIPYSSLSDDELSAALQVSEDGFYCEDAMHEYIYYNAMGRNYERQNMTILHEIGHCVLDHTGHGKDEETEAKFFAKYAIAPPPLIYRLGVENIQDVMNMFDISCEAAWYVYKYYKTWLKFHQAYGRFTEYEIRLLRLYKKSILRRWELMIGDQRKNA